jgi:hypothetical protein
MPPADRLGGAAKEFIAIRGEREERSVDRIGSPVEDDQAHRVESPGGGGGIEVTKAKKSGA